MVLTIFSLTLGGEVGCFRIIAVDGPSPHHRKDINAAAAPLKE